jgi:hypothetical protein
MNMKYYLVRQVESIIDKNNPFYGTSIERLYGKSEKVVGRKVLKYGGTYVDHIGCKLVRTYEIINYGFKRMRDAKRYISKARCDESLNKITYDIVEYDL